MLVLILESNHVLNHLLLLLDLDSLILILVRLYLLLSLQILRLLNTRVVLKKAQHLVEITLL